MSTGIDLVRQAYEAFKSGDADAMIAISDPEIEFGPSAAAPGGIFRGHAGVRRYLKEIEIAFGDRWDSAIERIADVGDDRVIVIARIFGQGKAGEPIDLRLAHIWEHRDGKLLRGTVYLDPHEALEAAEANTNTV
jgi:ketosteroid isomerase-like protein